MRSIFVLKSDLSERGNDVRTCMLTRIWGLMLSSCRLGLVPVPSPLDNDED